ncbi:hypothetical protein FC65_GL000663 [Ligilactobacillus acidipiscis DSM 15836]|uniref:IrrE N-terminal-like domain-containing protein n=1 Tax=Ligilactobacillus acidipiscis DSM 15836 TaxID=1423716 RepID=A0ABR5PLF8_9LACO|nr:hypothetical protein [Ligilactobacillus acidipiscis]KRM30325.1 hypothetical protein FC65_GL000663 [Ligilactobacillus acidipiscis DSM 15836]GAW63414.1 hypothetical protein Lacidipiscis_00597 [Ligilactobacillus acidipiscis]GEN19621.1 hypothetical protein LAC02_29020 [Ligilactobacillus acidipiscis]
MNIKVGGIHYEIFEKEIVENDPNEYGVCVYADNHIEIKSGLSDERKTQTLIHELLHAIFFEAGYEDHDEKMVDQLSLVLNQVLKENDLAELFD